MMSNPTVTRSTLCRSLPGTECVHPRRSHTRRPGSAQLPPSPCLASSSSPPSPSTRRTSACRPLRTCSADCCKPGCCAPCPSRSPARTRPACSSGSRTRRCSPHTPGPCSPSACSPTASPLPPTSPSRHSPSRSRSHIPVKFPVTFPDRFPLIVCVKVLLPVQLLFAASRLLLLLAMSDTYATVCVVVPSYAIRCVRSVRNHTSPAATAVGFAVTPVTFIPAFVASATKLCLSPAVYVFA